MITVSFTVKFSEPFAVTDDMDFPERRVEVDGEVFELCCCPKCGKFFYTTAFMFQIDQLECTECARKTNS